jgi:hypothetical protein
VVVTDTDVEWLLALPECPVLGPKEAGDWLLPVAEFLRFAESRGLAPEQMRSVVDAYALAHGGMRVSVGPRFPRLASVARRFSGRRPVQPGEVWMFEHGHVTALRAAGAAGPVHS